MAAFSHCGNIRRIPFPAGFGRGIERGIDLEGDPDHPLSPFCAHLARLVCGTDESVTKTNDDPKDSSQTPILREHPLHDKSAQQAPRSWESSHRHSLYPILSYPIIYSSKMKWWSRACASFAATAAAAAMMVDVVQACSDILVTPGASEDGSAMIAYNADDVSLFGYLYHYPATEGKQGEMIQIYEWDSGVSDAMNINI